MVKTNRPDPSSDGPTSAGDAQAVVATFTGEAGRSAGTGSDPFAAAVRRASMPMCVTDPLQGDNPIVFVNDAFLVMTGYGRDEVVGRNCRFLQGPETDPAAVAAIRGAIADADPTFQIDILNYRKDGRPFWNALFLSPVLDDDGKVRLFFSSQHDVTERKARELEVRDRRDELESEAKRQADALRKAYDELKLSDQTKSVLLHEVDHRVKNNLQMISSLIMLQARRIPDENIRLALRSMLERIDALSTVHRRLYQAEDVSRFDVAAFIRDLATGLVEASGRDDLALDLDLEPTEVPAVRAAPLALITNELITNAIKHGLKAQGGRIAVSARRDRDRLALDVRDDGAGMPAGGLGDGSLGHTIVKTLARQLQADLAWSPGAPGTVVTISMPLDQDG